MEKDWSKVLGVVKTRISSSNFRIWFANTSVATLTDTKIIISVPSAFVKDTIATKFINVLQDAIISAWSTDLEVEFKVDSSRFGKVPAEETEIDFSPPSVDRSLFGLNPKYTLQNFVVGLSNNLAYAAAQAVIQNPGISYNPLFIYGGTGVGKTHLMQAIGNALLEKGPGIKIIYCSTEKFTNDFVSGIQNKRTGDFRNRYRGCDLLLIDDIQFISGRDSTQEEFFHTFNELHTKNSQIVMTSDRPPNEMQKLESRLLSRFQGGLMVDIQIPDFDTRVAILKARCEERGEEVAEECLTIIAEHMTTNARELEGKLIQIIQAAKLKSTLLTPEVVKEYLNVPEPKIVQLDYKRVIAGVYQYFNIKLADLIGPRRKKGLVLPRQIAMYILYEDCRIPYERIGEMLGGRDHTTILHGVDKIKQAIIRDREIQRLVVEVKQALAVT